MYSDKKVILNTDVVLIDIIGFSDLDSMKQFKCINFITNIYRKMIAQMLKNSNMSLNKFILGLVSTSDGFYCILNPRLQGYGAILGLSFDHLSYQISKKLKYINGMRIAVHNTQIYEFKDILGHTNIIGDGLDECSGYLEFKYHAISTVLVSDSAYISFTKFLSIYKDYNALLIEKGFKHSEIYTFKDTHNEEKKGTLIWLGESGIINPPNINFNSVR